MLPAITASKVYSTLGNNNSLVPLAIKDIANSIGLTAGSYITGKEAEGKDRFIDEFGTQGIWLFGIPGYKKVLDWTIFKPFKYDPKVDARLLKDKAVLKEALNYADESVKGSIEKAAKNAKVFKGLTLGKFIASTALTILSYGALTKFRYKYTEEQIKKEALAEHAKQTIESSKLKQQINLHSPVAFSQAFSAVHNNTKNTGKQPSFTGKKSLEILDNFMFSPKNNLMIVDGVITGQRLAMSETKQDFAGYVIKEGTFWAFMYFAGEKIQKYLEKKADQKGKNISLDARVIESEELNQSMKTSKLSESLKAFKEIYNKTDAEIYKFINENQDNLVVKFAKQSDIIETMDKKILGFTIKKSEKIDHRRYIDIEDVKRVYKNLEKLTSQLDNYLKQSSENTIDKFLNEVKALKRASILKNIGSCIGALGILAPAIMILMRQFGDNKEFERKEKILAELQKQGIQA